MFLCNQPLGNKVGELAQSGCLTSSDWQGSPKRGTSEAKSTLAKTGLLQRYIDVVCCVSGVVMMTGSTEKLRQVSGMMSVSLDGFKHILGKM